MKTNRIAFITKSVLVLVLLLSILMVAFVGCDDKEPVEADFEGVDKILDGKTYSVEIDKSKISQKADSFVDKAVIERAGDVYYFNYFMKESLEFMDVVVDDKQLDCVKQEAEGGFNEIFSLTKEQMGKPIILRFHPKKAPGPIVIDTMIIVKFDTLERTSDEVKVVEGRLAVNTFKEDQKKAIVKAY